MKHLLNVYPLHHVYYGAVHNSEDRESRCPSECTNMIHRKRTMVWVKCSRKTVCEIRMWHINSVFCDVNSNDWDNENILMQL